MSPVSPSAEQQQRTDAAAAWWMRLEKDETVAFSIEFLNWIRIPTNEREFEAIGFAMKTFDDFKASVPIDELGQSAHSWFQNEQAGRVRSNWSSRKIVYAMAAASLTLAVGGAYYLWIASQPLSYATALGERRIVALQDGSHILLDSRSQVGIRYSKTARIVTLTKGRARFDVAHDTARPFSVAAGSEVVVAVGTSFDVELRGSKVLVTLIQGRVRIRDNSENRMSPKRPSAPVELSAGQQSTTFGDGKPAIVPADFGVAQAWETGHLVFRGERLADAAEQVNRYTDHTIRVDPSAASFRISGVFNTGDAKSFVNAATELNPIEADSSTDGTITLRKSP